MLNVRQVAEMFEVEPHTIRNWTDRGLLKADRVTPTGRRFYEEENIERLLKEREEEANV